MRKTILSTLSLLLLAVIACNKMENANLRLAEEPGKSQQVSSQPFKGGKTFLLTTNRMAKNPQIQFPSDKLPEEVYKKSEKKTYTIHFSADEKEIKIITENRSVITGKLQNKTEGEKYYKLSSGTTAGGRLLLWQKDTTEAEFTVYGSGVPVISTERGVMQPKNF